MFFLPLSFPSAICRPMIKLDAMSRALAERAAAAAQDSSLSLSVGRSVDGWVCVFVCGEGGISICSNWCVSVPVYETPAFCWSGRFLWRSWRAFRLRSQSIRQMCIRLENCDLSHSQPSNAQRKRAQFEYYCRLTLKFNCHSVHHGMGQQSSSSTGFHTRLDILYEQL